MKPRGDANPVYLSLDERARSLWDGLLDELGPEGEAALDDLSEEIWSTARCSLPDS